MTPRRAIRYCTDFRGRAAYTEYWRCAPVAFLAIPGLASIIYGGVAIGLGWSSLALGIVFHVAFLAQLAACPLWLAVTVRRLHDTGRSAVWLLTYAGIALGWAALIVWCTLTLKGLVMRQEGSILGFLIVAVLVSVVWVIASAAAAIIMLILCGASGTAGSNRYGPDPIVQDR